MATDLGEGKLWIQFKFPLKINLVSHPVSAVVFGNYKLTAQLVWIHILSPHPQTGLTTFPKRRENTISNGEFFKSLICRLSPDSFWKFLQKFIKPQLEFFIFERIKSYHNLYLTWSIKWNAVSSKQRPCRYCCITWTLIKRLEKKLDGNYSRMLRAILNKSWRQRPTKHQLYDHLPSISKTIQVRRAWHAGHFWRSRDELISDVLL